MGPLGLQEGMVGGAERGRREVMSTLGGEGRGERAEGEESA